MKSGRSRTMPPRRALTQLANTGETGALHVEGRPGGTIYLVDGQVSYVDSPAAPGVGELLTVSGRLNSRVWQAAVAAGEANGQVGQFLLSNGHLTVGELELCVLNSIFDAAFFVLTPQSAPVRFAPGDTHWLGVVRLVDAAALGREMTRRRRILDEIYPSAEVDAAVVTPAPRPPVERVVLTASQFELLVHADGQRTPADLAHLLGRCAYAVVQDLRRLAATGLLTESGSGKPVRPQSPTAATGTAPVVSNSRGTPKSTPSTLDGSYPESLVRAPPEDAALPKRTPGAALHEGQARANGKGARNGRRENNSAKSPSNEESEISAAAAKALAEAVTPDEALLLRIRAGLAAL